jgi:hypothetical protein
MIISTIFLILCFILSALCVASLFKNYMFNFITSKSKKFNIAIAFFVIAALIFAINGFADCLDYENALGKLQVYADYTSETIEIIKADAAKHKVNMIIYTILGYVFFCVHKSLLKRV